MLSEHSLYQKIIAKLKALVLYELNINNTYQHFYFGSNASQAMKYFVSNEMEICSTGGTLLAEEFWADQEFKSVFGTLVHTKNMSKMKSKGF